MDLYQIRYFLAVVETLNFTRAAERSFVSQPALTKAIQRLEEVVGGRLLDRSTKSVSLTSLGHAMLPSFKKIYDSTIEARVQARHILSQAQEKVRVGIMCTIDFQQMIQGFTACNEAHPEIEMSFHLGNLEMLTDTLDQGDIDIAIMCSPHDIPSRFTATPLFDEPFVLAFGNDHRFNGRQSISISELHRDHYCDRTACEFSDYIGQILDSVGVKLKVVHESDREDWIAAFVRANFGVAFMPMSLAVLANLAYVVIADYPIARSVKALVQTGKPITVAQRKVVDSISEHAWLST
jgi:LysR family transcriptional regulator, hydrogen peroxide-inducible genes activator